MVLDELKEIGFECKVESKVKRISPKNFDTYLIRCGKVRGIRLGFL